MINRRQHQEVAVANVCGIFKNIVMNLFNLNLLMLIILDNLYQGRNCYATFPPQPLLARRSVEQIEEEGGNEEIDSQLINKGQRGNIKSNAKGANRRILNHFVEQGSTRPDWY
ncbi:MAG: hypothetical protein EZS28_015575 [Streblomastix strix]|uniref:Uncharacterized protein n=1 Tax=Streblomastix strix TaxID=222440 RepID=A0A5J4W267_9EUKA|nr:MAG: hypothetical protein EZS28_015575 [Streblomastix strix]